MTEPAVTDFIKVCPKCGHSNPEFENACQLCNQFIGLEAPTPRPIAKKAPIEPASSPPKPASEPVPPRQPESFYLEVVGQSEIVSIEHGATLGQAHSSSTAEVQLADIPGANFIHRHHCRFELELGCWYVTAIDQKRYGGAFTNPTSVNRAEIAAGERREINNGDLLALSGVRFNIRII